MTTRVIFRKFRQGGDIIALFPHEPGTNDPAMMSCYQHVGQHGSMSDRDASALTVTAAPSEYADLHKELVGQGYTDLDVRLNLTAADYKKRKNELARQVATSYLKPFTVIGYYSDTDGRFNDHVRAKSPKDAIKFTEGCHSGSLVIIDVLAGHHKSLMEGL